jgi:hypothetical protein
MKVGSPFGWRANSRLIGGRRGAHHPASDAPINHGVAVTSRLARAALAPITRLIATAGQSQVYRSAATTIAPRSIHDLALTSQILSSANACFCVASHARSIYPESLAGRSATTASTARLAGCAPMPTGTGFILAGFPANRPQTGYSPVAYWWIFASIASSFSAGLAVYLTSRDRIPGAAEAPPVTQATTTSPA